MPRKTRRKRKTKKRFRKNNKKTLSRRKLKYYKKKFKKFTKKYRKKMKGGSKFTYGCKNPQNMGELITGYANNTNPFLPDPKLLNSNLRLHNLQKGGGVMYDFGLGDLLLNYEKATDFGKNIWHRYKGNKKEVSANTTHQPELRKNVPYEHTTGDLPEFYSLSAAKAAKNTIV